MTERIWRPVTRFSRTEDHTADVWIAGEAPDCPSLLISMLGTLYLIVAEEYLIGAGGPEEFVVNGASREEAMVRFLSEALFLLEARGIIMVDTDVETTSKGEGLVIRVKGMFCPFTIPEGKGGI